MYTRDFAGEIKKIIKNFPDSEDKKYILDKIERNELLPKAVSKQNGVIPYQLHLVELNKILSNAERYLPFLKKKKMSMVQCPIKSGSYLHFVFLIMWDR